MTDFIIVGRGLAACVMAHTLHGYGLSFKIIGVPDLSRASLVAAGIWNPVVFKRLTKSWLAHETIPFLKSFYAKCEKNLGEKLVHQRHIVKPFTQDQEKQLWLKKAEYELDGFIDEQIYRRSDDELKHCVFENEYGRVKEAGNLNITKFLETTAAFFHELLLHEEFDYNELAVTPTKTIYKNIESKNIIFCEGYLVKNNPWFKWIPLKPVKGEVLSVSSPELELKEAVFNKNGFIMHLNNGIYKTGSTYEWEDLSGSPSAKGLRELEEKLSRMISSEYTILKHEAGIRPSSADRRPIIGSHPVHSNLFVFNGLGTKGVMLAPYFADNFVLFYLKKQKLNKEVDVARCYSLYLGE